MTSRTWRRVDSLTFRRPLTTRETVPMPTPAAAATSAIVGRAGVRTGVPPERRCPVGSDSNAVGLIVARGLMFVNSLPSVAVRHAADGGRGRRAGPLMAADQARHESGPSRNVAGDTGVSKIESIRLKSF